MGPGSRFLVAWALVSAALAGCVGSDPGALSGATKASSISGSAAANDTLASPAGLPILGPPVDLWGPVEEKELYNGTIEVAECGGTEDQALNTVFGLAFGQQVMFGCAHWRLPAGTLVPEGTQALRFEADASRAKHLGKWYSVVVSYGYREYGDGHWDGDGTTESVRTWTFPLRPQDWDLPTHPESAFTLGFWTWGDPVNALYGPVQARIVAERDPDWKPLAPLDHWQLPEWHRFWREDAMNLLDANVTWKQPSGLESLQGTDWPDALELDDIVPLGAKKVSVAVAWDEIQGCPQHYECDVWVDVVSAGDWQSVDPKAEGSQYRIFVYDVPKNIGEDGPYVNESNTIVWPFVGACSSPGLPASCTVGANGFAKETALRVVVDAWKNDADVAALKGRLGLQ